MIPSDFNIHISIDSVQSRLIKEVGHSAAEIALVLWEIVIDRGQARVDPCDRFGIVIGEIGTRSGGEVHLPS
jgi:hypothetical protein